MEIPDIDNFNNAQLQERYFNVHYNDLYKYIHNKYQKKLKWAEKLYLYYNNIGEPPKCMCPGCNNPVKFISIHKGYQKYCSCKCINDDPIVRNKMKQTSLDHYGCENPFQSEEIKNKIKQSKQNLGINNINQIFIKTHVELLEGNEIEIPNIEELYEENRLKEQYIKNHFENFYKYINSHYNKISNWIEKLYLYYNNLEEPPECDNPNCNKRAKFISFYRGYNKYCCFKCSNSDPARSIKTKQTNLERYGKEWYLQTDEFKEKSIKTLQKHYNIDNIFKLPNFYKLYPNSSQPTSKSEIELQNYIEHLGYQIVRNARDIIKNYELDIYIPNLNIAIEYNGIYWHSILNKEPKYHINKWKACYNAGIELISIWESWDVDIVYQFLKDKLEGSDISIYKNLIFPNLIEWPLDFGYPNSKMDIQNIKEHKCIYNGYECYDSGII